MARLCSLTQTKLKEILDYDPITGVFRWRDRINGGRGWKSNKAGQIAGADKDGYVQIQIDWIGYKAHRLAFLWMTGSIPDVIDHVNCSRSDNRWCNIRVASHTLNKANIHRRSDNTSSYKGVVKHLDGRWRARINVDGRCIHLGLFDRIEDAAATYRAAAITHFGEFARAS